MLDKPEPGFYKLKRKSGFYVAARIRYEPPRDPVTGETLDRSFYFYGEIDGRPDPEPDIAGRGGSSLTQVIWIDGVRITEEEYNYLLADRAWVRDYAPHLPEARVDEKIDLGKLSPDVLFGKKSK